MNDMIQELFYIEMHLVYDPMKERKTGLDLENGPEYLRRQLHILQEPGGYVKIKYQVRLLLIKKKMMDYVI